MTREASNKSQIDGFKETARQLGCEKDEAGFDEELGRFAKQKPKDANEAELIVDHALIANSAISIADSKEQGER